MVLRAGDGGSGRADETSAVPGLGRTVQAAWALIAGAAPATLTVRADDQGPLAHALVAALADGLPAAAAASSSAAALLERARAILMSGWAAGVAARERAVGRLFAALSALPEAKCFPSRA